MREYDLYVRPPSRKGTYSWLEELLDKEFGHYRKTTAYHDGSWNGLEANLQGKLNGYSVQGDERQARRFFDRLKARLKEMGVEDFLVIEKEAPGPQGEPAGERI